MRSSRAALSCGRGMRDSEAGVASNGLFGWGGLIDRQSLRQTISDAGLAENDGEAIPRPGGSAGRPGDDSSSMPPRTPAHEDRASRDFPVRAVEDCESDNLGNHAEPSKSGHKRCRTQKYAKKTVDKKIRKMAKNGIRGN